MSTLTDHADALERAAAFLRSQSPDGMERMPGAPVWAASWEAYVRYANEQDSFDERETHYAERIAELEADVTGLLAGQDELARLSTARVNELEAENNRLHIIQNAQADTHRECRVAANSYSVTILELRERVATLTGLLANVYHYAASRQVNYTGQETTLQHIRTITRDFVPERLTQYD